MQGDDVRHHQSQQHQRQGNDMQREEAVQRGVGDDEIAANPHRQIRADHRNSAEQIDDHLRAPEGHLTPRQQVAHEGFGHQAQEDHHAEEPDQFARLLVGAVNQRPEHVQVDDDEERRRAGGMHVADQPAPVHVAHDVFDRGERLGGGGLVVHGQPDAGQNLIDQHQNRQRAEEVPEVEVFRRVILGQMLAHHLGERKALVNPAEHAGRALCIGHYAVSGSTPINTRESLRYR